LAVFIGLGWVGRVGWVGWVGRIGLSNNMFKFNYNYVICAIIVHIE